MSTLSADEHAGEPRRFTGDVEIDAYRSLAVRDLLRGSATSLPSGESVADAMGIAPLRADPDSYLTMDPSWTPTLPSRNGTSFSLADLLIFARDQQAAMK
jgi:hypothetical protein